jgi:hypothetical protein
LGVQKHRGDAGGFGTDVIRDWYKVDGRSPLYAEEDGKVAEMLRAGYTYVEIWRATDVGRKRIGRIAKRLGSTWASRKAVRAKT